MKQMFKSLGELAARLDADNKAKADYVMPVKSVSMDASAGIVLDGIDANASHQITEHGHGQIATYLDIPRAYYDRMRGHDKALLASNVNHWLGTKADDRRMVRMLNGTVRALLSDRYQRIDNFEVAEVALNVLSDLPGLRIASCAVTESRLHIKAVSTAVEALVQGSKRGKGDLVQAGVYIGNSEVGLGSVQIKPFAEFLWCTNGMVRDGETMSAKHVGRKIDASIEGMLSDQTRRLEDEVVLRKVRDVIQHAFDAAAFQRFIGKLTATTVEPIKGDVPAAVEALGPTLGLTQGERSSVLRHLIEGGDLSRYGLMNAVTRTAEDLASYDRATELETLGYKLIDLGARDWHAISEAKPIAMAA